MPDCDRYIYGHPSDDDPQVLLPMGIIPRLPHAAELSVLSESAATKQTA